MNLFEWLKELTEEDIETKCGERVFFRAENYLDEVSDIQLNGNELYSLVQGTMSRPYKVKISYCNGDLVAECSCPAEMCFCKHIAATLLVARSRNIVKIKSTKILNADIASYISELDKEELVALVKDYAKRFDQIREEIGLKMAKKSNDKINTKTYVDNINRTVFGFVDYYQMHDFIADLEKIRESIMNLSREFPEDASEILEHFIRKCIVHYENCDDSNGDYGQFIEELVKLHAETLTAFKCNQNKVVQWIIHQWKNNDYGFGDDVLDVYSKALREEGLNILRKYFLPKFQNMNKSMTSSRWNDRYWYSSTKEFLLGVYDLLQDDQNFLKVAENTLFSADDYAVLVRKFERLGRTDDAVKRCRQGLAKNKDNLVLLEILAYLYRKKNERKKELDTMIRHFNLDPDSDLLNKIRSIAQRKGQWEKYRERMIGVLYKSGYYDLLAQLYMDDKNYSSLIKLAYEKDCDRGMKERIARFIVQNYPQESIKLYKMVIVEAVSEMKNHSYRKAAKLMANLKKLHLEQDRKADWHSYLEQIKTEHKTKRNFMGELRRIGLIDARS